LDEKWSFVQKKEKNCAPEGEPGCGDNWDHVAFDPEHRLVLKVVILIDPLYKLALRDENSNAEISSVMQEFNRLAKETRAAVLLVHHTAKWKN